VAPETSAGQIGAEGNFRLGDDPGGDQVRSTLRSQLRRINEWTKTYKLLHNLIQSLEKKVVGFSGMRDKEN
jgi:hypothetical protein